ncbi:MAG TPA: preprotein translocase subunit SecG [Acidimicrobiia bacterium]|nr:preprotein translocase subunit SecG [Acidimicrobiia bacterium]
MLTIVLVVIHIISATAMLVFVLLHAGRGGGLSDLFGGGSMGGAMAGSTVVEKNLDRLTVIAAIVFTFTSIVLGITLK